MIQRVQTIWLLLAALAGFGATQVALYKGTPATGDFHATQCLPLFAAISLAALLAVIAIFLFKNRKTQMRVVIIGMLVSAATIALEVWQISAFQSKLLLNAGSYYWGALLPIAMFICLLLAAVNIRKDQKLIKSLDRFR